MLKGVKYVNPEVYFHFIHKCAVFNIQSRKLNLNIIIY
jgi:hypothetical protein